MFFSNNLFPFATLNDQKLHKTLSQSNNHYSGSSAAILQIHFNIETNINNLSNIFNEFNNLSFQHHKSTENIINCKYYDIEETKSLGMPGIFFTFTHFLSLKIL